MKPKYFSTLIQRANKSHQAEEYYKKIKKIPNYSDSVLEQLKKEHGDRTYIGERLAIVFCYDPFVLKEWLNIYHNVYELALVIFPDVDFLYTMSNKKEFDCLWQYDIFKPIAFQNERYLTNSILANLMHYNADIKGVMLYKYEQGDSLYSTINHILNCVYDYYNYAMVDMNTSRLQGEAVLENEIVSLGKFGQYPTLDGLVGLQKDKPIICIAAGRSLQDDLKLLKEIREEVYIIACSAVVKPLLKVGIKPDLVTIVDMQNSIIKYLDGVDEDLTITIATCANKNMWELSYNKIICPYVLIPDSYYYNVLKEYNLEPKTTIGACLTVAFMSIQIAHLMGASKIILLGQDLCYKDMKTHIDNTTFCRDIKDGQYTQVETIDGKTALVDKQFETMASYLEKKINELKLDVINCSKGQHLVGTKEMSLKKAYNQFLSGHTYKDIPLGLKTQSRAFKRGLRLKWHKLKLRCEELLQYNDTKIAKEIDRLPKDMVEYARKRFDGVDRFFLEEGVNNKMLLNMIIDVAKKYEELL